jgi:hypothetical protein
VTYSPTTSVRSSSRVRFRGRRPELTCSTAKAAIAVQRDKQWPKHIDSRSAIAENFCINWATQRSMLRSFSSFGAGTSQKAVPLTGVSRLVSRSRRVRAAQTTLPEPSGDEKVALESVDLVPQPGPVTDVASAPKPQTVTLDSFGALADSDFEQAPSSGGFELTKTQSFWLLNLVAFLYGTNTTCAPPPFAPAQPRVLCAVCLVPIAPRRTSSAMQTHLTNLARILTHGINWAHAVHSPEALLTSQPLGAAS